MRITEGMRQSEEKLDRNQQGGRGLGGVSHLTDPVTREQFRAQLLEQAQAAISTARPAIMVPPEWLVELLTVEPPLDRHQLGPEPLGGYTVTEIARAIRRHPHTVWVWVKRGVLRGYRLGSQWRIPADGIEDFLHHLQRPDEAPEAYRTRGRIRKGLRRQGQPDANPDKG